MMSFHTNRRLQWALPLLVFVLFWSSAGVAWAQFAFVIHKVIKCPGKSIIVDVIATPFGMEIFLTGPSGTSPSGKVVGFVGDLSAEGDSVREIFESLCRRFLTAQSTPASTNATTDTPVIGEHLVGREPVDLTRADVNHDGITDLVVANRLSHNVSVLLGDADRTFREAVNFPTGENPVQIEAGDFTGDGVPDLITRHARGLSLLVNNGNGAFQAPVSVAPVGGASDVVTGLVVADFNGDGKLDLAVSVFRNAPPFAGETSILLGNGDGTFQAPAVIAGQGGVVLAAARLDGDPHVDLVVGGSVLLGRGDGTFQPGQALPAGLALSAVRVADVNGDGRPDLVGLSSAERAVSVHVGNGDGTFQAPRHFGVAPSGALTVADIDGDGRADVLTSDTSVDHLSLLIGSGDGTFQGAPVFRSGPPTGNQQAGASSVAVADFDADGLLDFAVGHGFNNATVVRGLPGGGFAPPTDLGRGRGHVAGGDFNGDGRPDVAVCGADDFGNNLLSLFLGSGTGTFGAPLETTLPDADLVSCLATDLDGAGGLDVLVLFRDRISALLGTGTGTFQAAIHTPGGTRFQAISVTDLNGDGRPDLAVADGGDFGLLNGHVAVFLGNGDGTFQRAGDLLPGTSALGVTAGDLDRDGRIDLAAIVEAVQFTFSVAILRGNGDGTFQAPTGAPTPPASDFFPGSAMAVATVDLDDNPDLILFVDGTQVAVLPGNGDGTFRAPVRFDASGNANLLVTDLNGDAKPDLVIPNGENAVSILINASTAAPPPPTTPTLTLQLNQTAFRPGQTLIATATLTPGATPAVVDAYVVVQLPGGALLSLQLGGGLVPGVVPIAAGFTPVPLTQAVVTYTFTGAEPEGAFTFFTGLAASGSSPPAVIGSIDQDAFTFTR
jgi:hypothetical protein